jgi:hypothetical protein
MTNRDRDLVREYSQFLRIEIAVAYLVVLQQNDHFQPTISRMAQTHPPSNADSHLQA